MAWYRLNLPVQAAELDARIDEYRALVESAVARLGGRDMSARVYSRREASGHAQIFLEVSGRQPSWFVLKLIRCEAAPEPPRGELTLLGEVVDGAARVGDPVRPA